MNQILQTNSNNNKFKRILKFQFYLSIILIICISTLVLYNRIKLSHNEKYSEQILDNYNITKLYSNLSLNENYNSTKIIENFYVIGIIEIPQINVNYPIFSNYNDELLKISPCRFYGCFPGEIGNLCIAGHNYDNNKFFSRISALNENDEIIVYDSYNKKFSYYVCDIYEVKPDDLSPIYIFNGNSKILTLVTCNNFNNNRIIVKAICRT